MKFNVNGSTTLRIVAISMGVFGLAVTPLLMSAWHTEHSSYMFIGRMFFPAYIGAMAGMLYFRHQLRYKPVFWGRVGYWLAFAALTLALVGDLGAFWSDGNNFAIRPLSRTQSALFSLDFLGSVIAQIGILYYALGLLWSDSVPSRIGWIMAGAAIVGIPMSFMHIPSGTIFATSLFWMANSIGNWSGEGSITSKTPLHESTGEDELGTEHS